MHSKTLPSWFGLLGISVKILRFWLYTSKEKRVFYSIHVNRDNYFPQIHVPSVISFAPFSNLAYGKTKLLVLQAWLCSHPYMHRIRAEQLASHSWSVLHSFWVLRLQATKCSLTNNCHYFHIRAHRCKDSGKIGKVPNAGEGIQGVNLRAAR